MNTVFTILTVLIVLACVLLILVVLLQNGKGDGLASNFIAGNQTFGVRQTTDILEKITWVLVCFIIVVAVLASFTTKSSKSELDLSDAVSTEAPAPEFPSAPEQLPLQ